MATSVGVLRGRIAAPKLLVLAVILGVFEGADLASMGLTLSRLSKVLTLTPGQAGLCASASLLGLVIGSVVGGRSADAHGRRPVLVVSAALLGVFSVLTAFSWSFESLLVIRLLAGLGIGGLFPVLIAMARDAAAPGFRATGMSLLLAIGPVGAIIAGLIALAPDWRWVFFFGGFGPLVTLPAVFLVVRAGTDGIGPVVERSEGASLGATFFGDGRTAGTVLIWVISFCTILASYVMINWLPSLLIRQGFPSHEAHVAAIIYSLGGLFGNIVAGRVLDRGLVRSTFVVTYAGVSACIAGLSIVSVAPMMFVLVFGANFFVLGAQLVTFSLASRFYPEQVRTTGLGAVVSSGRLGSVVGPVLAGQLLSLGLAANSVYLLLIPGFVLAVVLGLPLARLVLRADRGQNSPVSATTLSYGMEGR